MTAQENFFPSFDEIITHIYQGPLEPSPWKSFLRCLLQRLDCDAVSMTLHSTAGDTDPFTLYECKDPASEALFAKLPRGGHGANPLLRAMVHSGEVMTIEQVLPRPKLLTSSYYLEVMKPLKVEYMLSMRLDSGNGIPYFLFLTRGPGRPNFTQKSKQYLHLLHSHLEYAFKAYALLKRHELEKEIYSEALNRLTIGTVILDGQGKVLQVNRAAHQILKNSTCASLCDGRLSITKSRYREEFTRLLNAAISCRERQLPDTFVEALRIEGTSGADLGLLIRTAPASTWYQDEGVPCVIIYVEDFEQDQSAPDQIIARLFRLTRSEARLAAMLANGYTLQEAAVKLNLTESSVRTYSKKIFAKMGVSRQAELVRMILKSIAGLARTSHAGADALPLSKARNINTAC